MSCHYINTPPLWSRSRPPTSASFWPYIHNLSSKHVQTTFASKTSNMTCSCDGLIPDSLSTLPKKTSTSSALPHPALLYIYIFSWVTKKANNVLFIRLVESFVLYICSILSCSVVWWQCKLHLHRGHTRQRSPLRSAGNQESVNVFWRQVVLSYAWLSWGCASDSAECMSTPYDSVRPSERWDRFILACWEQNSKLNNSKTHRSTV